MLKTIVLWILEWTFKKAYDFFTGLYQKKKIQDDIEEKTQAEAEALKKAETDEEFDRAARDMASGR